MTKKAFLILTLATAMATSAAAQDVLPLQAPDKQLPMTLMEALQQRHSTWQHPATPLTDAELATVLWAAAGINRPDAGRITAPSAINAQDIQVFVLRQDGTYRYDAAAHQLLVVNRKDLREAAAGRDPKPRTAPVILLLVSDLSKFGGRGGDKLREMAAFDAGYVSQNICLACTALGLNTVPRMTMDAQALKDALSLSEQQIPLLNHPISKGKE